MAKKAAAAPFKLGFRNSNLQEAPPFRPALNIGCLLDLTTGGFQPGKRGEMICTGGLSHLTGVGGLGNVNKSTLSHYMVLAAMDRQLPLVEVSAHDTEYSQSYGRWQMLSTYMPRLREMDLSTIDHFMLSSQDEISGNAFFEQMKERLKSKQEAKREYLLTTPFLDSRDRTGKAQLKQLVPSIIELDSLSAMSTDVGTEILNENEVGSGKAQTVFMRSAGAKSQIVMQIPDLAAQNGGYVLYTAHMGKEIQLDPYAPAPKKLGYLKNGLTFKNVPGNVTFLSNNLWMIVAATPELTRDKTVMYPKDSTDNTEGDTDLQRIMLLNLRGKGGPSGLPFEVLISQKQGVLPSLTEYHYLKSHGRYGLGGNDKDYFLDLHPDVKLSRTTIRGLCSNDLILQRAMTITSELLQLKLMFPEYANIMVSPKELYKGLIEKGYNWGDLLATRGYWVYEENEASKIPFLSTLDLLRVNAGLYTPYWK